jgi:hypothetical protein
MPIEDSIKRCSGHEGEERTWYGEEEDEPVESDGSLRSEYIEAAGQVASQYDAKHRDNDADERFHVERASPVRALSEPMARGPLEGGCSANTMRALVVALVSRRVGVRFSFP